MDVVLADIDAEGLERARSRIAAASPGVEAVAVAGDVGDPAHHDELVAAADRAGGLRLSVLNAGVSLPGLSWEAPLSRWEVTTRVNYWGVVHGVRAALSTMVPRADGWVVAVSSGAGLVATPGLAPYVATKHAVVGMMESAHHELARVGSPVGVSVVCPGNIATAGPDRPAMSGVDAAEGSAFPRSSLRSRTRRGPEWRAGRTRPRCPTPWSTGWGRGGSGSCPSRSWPGRPRTGCAGSPRASHRWTCWAEPGARGGVSPAAGRR